MPLYRIDTFDGDTWCRDETGSFFPAVVSARHAGMAALKDMAADRLLDGDRRDFIVDIRSEGGALVYTATLSLLGRYFTPDALTREELAPTQDKPAQGGSTQRGLTLDEPRRGGMTRGGTIQNGAS